MFCSLRVLNLSPCETFVSIKKQCYGKRRGDVGKRQQERRDEITLTKKESHQWHFKKTAKTVKSGGESNSFQC